MYNSKLKENSSLEKEAQEMLQKWEAGDKKTLQLWKMMNDWAIKGIGETYTKFGVKFNKHYFESKIYKKGTIFAFSYQTAFFIYF